MSHFVKLDDDNKVIDLIYLPTINNINPVTGQEIESYGIDYLTTNHGGGNWKQYSQNTHANTHTEGRTPFRKNVPQIGWTYDSDRDAFIPPDSLKPYESWVWDDDRCWWKAPVDMPTDGITEEERRGLPLDEGGGEVRPYYWSWSESTNSWMKTNSDTDDPALE